MIEQTPTRFAILGHLALRDWSAYELTRSLRRTLHWFWPRAESVIYAEVKRLEKLGLAKSHKEPAVDGSSRERVVYRITPRGRRALADWLATPTSGIAVSIEPLLRLHLARFGTKADLVHAIESLESTAADLLSDARAVATEFVEGRHVLQDEAHVRGLLFDALWSLGTLLHDWAKRAHTEVERWPSLDGDEPARRRGVKRMRDALETPVSGPTRSR